MNRSSSLAIISGLALAVTDYAIVAAAFLHRPLGGEIVLLMVATVFLFGIVLRCTTLIYTFQAIVIAPVLLRLGARPQDLHLEGIPIVGVTAACVAALSRMVVAVYLHHAESLPISAPDADPPVGSMRGRGDLDL